MVQADIDAMEERLRDYPDDRVARMVLADALEDSGEVDRGIVQRGLARLPFDFNTAFSPEMRADFARWIRIRKEVRARLVIDDWYDHTWLLHLYDAQAPGTDWESGAYILHRGWVQTGHHLLGDVLSYARAEGAR